MIDTFDERIFKHCEVKEMYRGLLIVNAFLRTNKFDELYTFLADAAHKEGMALEVATNAELVCALEESFEPTQYDFVVFWDKDILLAQRLEQLGMRLYNNARSIALCDDKSLTWLALKDEGIPMPRTVPAPKTFPNIGYPSLDFAKRIGCQLGYPVVVKECCGSFGQQVYLCCDEQQLLDRVAQLAGTPILFQQAITESMGHDVRINVVGGQVVASILRHSTDGDFRSNLTLGGSMEPYTPTEAEAQLAIRTTQLLGLDFAGVDVLFGENGPILCEVNSNAHFKTTLACTGINMAEAIMHYIKEQLSN